MTKAEQINDANRAKAIGKIFLIAIGINQYDQSVGNLKNCCTDATIVFNTVKDKEYFPMNDNSILITSDNDSTQKQPLLDQINSCGLFIDECTNIVFYYNAVFQLVRQFGKPFIHERLHGHYRCGGFCFFSGGFVPGRCFGCTFSVMGSLPRAPSRISAW